MRHFPALLLIALALLALLTACSEDDNPAAPT